MCICSENTVIKIRNKSPQELSLTAGPAGFSSQGSLGNGTEWLAEALATVQKYFYDVDRGARRDISDGVKNCTGSGSKSCVEVQEHLSNSPASVYTSVANCLAGTV